MDKKARRKNRKSRLSVGVLIVCCLLICSLAACNSGGKNDTSPDKAEQAAGAENGALVSATAQTAEETEPTEEAAPDPEIEKILAGMTLEEKVGQMFMPSFRVWQEEADAEGMNLTVQNADDEGQEVNVTELNDRIRECIAKYHFGGVLLFAENLIDDNYKLIVNP